MALESSFCSALPKLNEEQSQTTSCFDTSPATARFSNLKVKRFTADFMADRIKVTHICETVKGGIATYLGMLLQTMAASTDNRTILPDSQLSELGEANEVILFPDTGRGLRRLWRLFRTTHSHVNSSRSDILFFHSTFTLPVMAAFRLMGVPGRYIYCAHGWAALRYPANSTKRRFVASIEGRLCGFADAVINISTHDHNYACVEHYHGDQRLIENAVLDLADNAIPAPFSRDESNINLLFIGRFDRQKGLDILLDAFRKARAQRPELRLHIVGESVLGDSAHQNHDECLQGVAFHGWQTPAGVQGFCEAADILVVPSRWEGFGLVVPEALRASTPVMVSDQGALPGLVESGSTGFIIPLSVDEFARALGNLKKQQLAAMRPVCRRSYEQRFHASRFGQELGQLYKVLNNQ